MLEYQGPGISNEGSPNTMNFIPWKKMLGGYQSAVGDGAERKYQTPAHAKASPHSTTIILG